MTKLRYLGSRDLKFTDPRFGVEYDFTGEDKTCDVEDAHAAVMLRESPRGYEIVSQTGTILAGAPTDDEDMSGPGQEGTDEPEKLEIKV